MGKAERHQPHDWADTTNLGENDAARRPQEIAVAAKVTSAKREEEAAGAVKAEAGRKSKGQVVCSMQVGTRSSTER